MSQLDRALWLVPATFVVHVMEESAGFADWVQRHGRRDYSSRDFVHINASGLLLTLATTIAVTRRPGRWLFVAYYALIATQQMLFNPVFHVGSTVAYRDWSPGTATALVLFLPMWWRLTRLALRDGRLNRRSIGGAIAVGGLVHGAAVAQQVFGGARRPSQPAAAASRTASTMSRKAAASGGVGPGAPGSSRC